MKRWQNRKPNANWNLDKDHPHNKTGRDIGFTDDLKEKSKSMDERFNEPIDGERTEQREMCFDASDYQRLQFGDWRLTESALQKWCVSWFDEHYPRIARSHTANQSNAWKGQDAKNMGYWKGFPDLIICKPKLKVRTFPDLFGGNYETKDMIYAGLFVEFKTKKNRTGRSAEQKATHELLSKEGYLVVVVWDYEQFKEVVNDYFKEA